MSQEEVFNSIALIVLYRPVDKSMEEVEPARTDEEKLEMHKELEKHEKHEKFKKKKKQQRDENKKRLKLNDMNEDPSDAVDKVMVDIAVQTAVEMAEKETQTIPIEKGTVEMGVQTAGEKTEKETQTDQTDQTPGITVACQTGWAPALGMKKDKKKDKKKKKKQQQQQPSTSTKPVVEYTDDRMVVTPAMAKSKSGNDRMAKKFARDNPGATWAQFRAFRKN